MDARELPPQEENNSPPNCGIQEIQKNKQEVKKTEKEQNCSSNLIQENNEWITTDIVQSQIHNVQVSCVPVSADAQHEMGRGKYYLLSCTILQFTTPNIPTPYNPTKGFATPNVIPNKAKGIATIISSWGTYKQMLLLSSSCLPHWIPSSGKLVTLNVNSFTCPYIIPTV